MTKSNYVLIQGLGLNQGGVGAARYFANQGKSVLVTDLKPRSELKTSVEALSNFNNIEFVLGKHCEEDFAKADLVISSPVVPPNSKYVQLARDNKVPVYCPLSYFLSHKKGLTIGVTGTRGKSTTTSLIYQILRRTNKSVYLGGNIGRSVLDFLDQLTKDSISVLEISSFMLDWLKIENQSPEIAVLTNIYPDHLDWHGSLDEYIRAKKQIFKDQNNNQIAFLNLRNREIKRLARQVSGKLIDFTKEDVDFNKLNLDAFHSLSGEHNQENIKAAISVCRYLNVDEKAIEETIKEYQGLYGRQMCLGEFNGVKVINDTCATIPEAVVAALARFKEYPIVLLTGGKDKGVSYQKLAKKIKNQQLKSVIILAGSGGKKLKEELQKINFNNFHQIDNFEEGVDLAMSATGRGDIFIFSPGGSSFERFANEFERGRCFDRIITAS